MEASLVILTHPALGALHQREESFALFAIAIALVHLRLRFVLSDVLVGDDPLVGSGHEFRDFDGVEGGADLAGVDVSRGILHLRMGLRRYF